MKDTNEMKTCPLNSVGICLGKNCAWWVDAEAGIYPGGCAVARIGIHLRNIEGDLDEMCVGLASRAEVKDE